LNLIFEYQKKFSWSQNKRYDFYIKDNHIIIEVNGLQHYEEKFKFKTRNLNLRNLKVEQENDIFKEQLAKENGIIKYIVIDARKSELEWIKNSILNSELSELFDLSNIDWLKCHEFACSSLVKKACDLWNSGMKSTIKIGNNLMVNPSTASRYLKYGVELNLCDYNPLEIKNTVKFKCKSIVQLDFNTNKLIKTYQSMHEAAKIHKIPSSTLTRYCNYHKLHLNYKWMYLEDYNKIISEQNVTNTYNQDLIHTQ